MFLHVKRYDTLFAWMNLTLLLFVVVMPFSTDLLSEYTSAQVAVVFYALNAGSISLLLAIMWWYATKGSRLVEDDFDEMVGRHVSISFLGIATVFVVSVGIAFINTSAAMYFWLASIPVSISIDRVHHRMERAHRSEQ